jgi:hypothetical protein
VSRPPAAEERLDLTALGQVRYRLKTPYPDGPTHIVLEPLDLERGGRTAASRSAAAETKLVYVLVNVRTDGERILCATMSEADRSFEIETIQSRFWGAMLRTPGGA